MAYQLTWIRPVEAPDIRLPEGRRLEIGRDKSNHLHLPDGPVSRHHASLIPTESGWRLLDQKATNGVFVNGARVDDVLLRPDDEVHIGGYRFRIEEVGDPAASAFSFTVDQATITVGLGLDVGVARQPPNEDHVGTFSSQQVGAEKLAERGHLFVVSDGMGGHRAGEVASEIAVQETLANYYAADEPVQDGNDIPAVLTKSIQEANQAVRQRGQEQPELGDMGATLVSAVVAAEQIVVANVGDSRAYRLRQGKLEQLTVDQTIAQELFSQGVLSTAEFAESPLKHRLLQAMGQRDDLKVEIKSKSVRPGDVFLLCSDGLTNAVSDADIIDVLKNHKGEAAVQQLIDKANANGGPDNISVIVLHVEPAPAGAQS